jgi:hypothetical protein
VQELLQAGIDVITALNVQHLESLNDAVEAVTSVRQAETVPDAVVAARSRRGVRRWNMKVSDYSFGSVRVDGVTYDHDLILDRGKIRKRDKAASRRFRGEYGHTPLSAAEDIPWRCRRLVIGTGADGELPVLQEVRDEARRRKVDLVVLPTAEAIGVLTGAAADTNAILHLTC